MKPPSPKLTQIIKNFGWVEEFDLPILINEGYGELIVLIKFDSYKRVLCHVRDAALVIKTGRDSGDDYDEMGFTIPMYDVLCSYYGFPNNRSTNKQVEMVN